MTRKLQGGPNTQSDERGKKHQNNEGHQGGQHGGSKREGEPDTKRTSAYSPSEPGESAKTTPKPKR